MNTPVSQRSTGKLPRTAILGGLLMMAAISAQAANVVNTVGDTITTTQQVTGGNNHYQFGSGSSFSTVNINAGGSLQIVNAQFETIIGQNAVGNWTMNINTGGSLDSSTITGGDRRFYLGNQDSGANGIINLNGGTFDGTGFTSVIFGRNTAHGYFNLSAGTATFAAAPTLNQDSYFNFTTGSTASLTITGANAAYWQGLYTNSDLFVNNSNASNFATTFALSNGGQTITAIPEPSASALVGLAGFGLLLRRRR